MIKPGLFFLASRFFCFGWSVHYTLRHQQTNDVIENSVYKKKHFPGNTNKFEWEKNLVKLYFV